MMLINWKDFFRNIAQNQSSFPDIMPCSTMHWQGIMFYCLTLNTSTIRFIIRHSARLFSETIFSNINVFIGLFLQGQYHVNRLRNLSLFAVQIPKQNMRDGSQSSWRQRERESLLPPLTAACSRCANNKSFNHLWALIQWSIIICSDLQLGGLYLQKTIKCNRSVLVALLVDKSLHNNRSQQK